MIWKATWTQWKGPKVVTDPVRPSRRLILLGGVATGTLTALPLRAQSDSIWSAAQAFEALIADRIRLVDIRSRGEWTQTGVAEGAWPISLHEPRFLLRLLAAQAHAEDRPVAVICAVGGRSNVVLKGMLDAGYDGIIDVSEGMMGSPLGPGWIAGGYPVVSVDAALAALPTELA